jgi:hypothetical protein
MQYNRKTIHLSLPKTCSDYQEVEDSMGLKALRFHKIPFEYGRVSLNCRAVSTLQSINPLPRTILFKYVILCKIFKYLAFHQTSSLDEAQTTKPNHKKA